MKPGPLALRLLAIVKAKGEAWAAAPCELTRPAAYRRLTAKNSRLIEEMRRIGRRIAKAPVRTLADVVDKAIVAAWADVNDDDEDLAYLNLWDGILGLAGLSCADVDEVLCTRAPFPAG